MSPFEIALLAAIQRLGDAIGERGSETTTSVLDPDTLLEHEQVTITSATADEEDLTVVWANRMLWLEDNPVDGDGDAITLDMDADGYERLGMFFLAAAATLRAEAP